MSGDKIKISSSFLHASLNELDGGILPDAPPTLSKLSLMMAVLLKITTRVFIHIRQIVQKSTLKMNLEYI